MTAANNSEHELKQQVFGRLAFLGMPQGDAAKFAQLSINLAMAGSQAQGFQNDIKKLTRGLSRHVGKPRAHLFAKWLTERIPQVCDTAVAAQFTSSALVVPKDSEPQGSPALVPEGNLQPTVACQPRLIASKSATSKGLMATSEKAVVDEAWVEVKSKEGKTYFWNRSENSCNWELPVGIRAKWVSHKSNEGRTYYSDRNGRTVWVLPPLQKSSQATKTTEDNLKRAQVETPVLALQQPSVRTSIPVAEPEELIPVLATRATVGPLCGVLESPISACPSPLQKRKSLETKNAREEEQSQGGADSWVSWAQDTLGIVWDHESEAPDSPEKHSDGEPTPSSSSVASAAADHTMCEEPSKEVAVSKPTQLGDCPQMCSPSKEDTVHDHNRARSRSPRRDMCSVAKHGKCRTDKILLARSPHVDVAPVTKHGKCKQDKILFAARQGDVVALQQPLPQKTSENLNAFINRRTQLCRQASNGGA